MFGCIACVGFGGSDPMLWEPVLTLENFRFICVSYFNSLALLLIVFVFALLL
jgi:hypothetical protein